MSFKGYHLLRVLFSTILFISCDKKIENKVVLSSPVISQADVDSLKTQEHNHWSYEGETSPEHWSELGENDCGGNRQSPINIITKDIVTDSIPLLNFKDFHYLENTKINSVVNNGHTIQYNFDEGNYLKYNEIEYKLVQFHFHVPAEHLINGVRYPLEIQMEHISSDKKVLMLSFVAEEGEENNNFKELEEFLPLKKHKEKAAKFSYDFLANIDKDFKYYHYIGSLTTPPCTEGVDWFIIQKPIILSEKQVDLFHASMPNNNYRPTQLLNDRVVSVN